MFDDHVVFEGQVSSQRSTRTRSVASFYYCTYLASLEWAIFKTFLKIYGSKYTHQLVLFKGFFQMCLHAPYRKIRISAEVLCSRIGTAFAQLFRTSSQLHYSRVVRIILVGPERFCSDGRELLPSVKFSSEGRLAQKLKLKTLI